MIGRATLTRIAEICITLAFFLNFNLTLKMILGAGVTRSLCPSSQCYHLVFTINLTF